jgi:hypothetical protein
MPHFGTGILAEDVLLFAIRASLASGNGNELLLSLGQELVISVEPVVASSAVVVCLPLPTQRASMPLELGNVLPGSLAILKRDTFL